MRVGCCAFNFTWLSPPASIEFARSLGFTVVDVGAARGAAHLRQTDLVADPRAAGLEVAATAREAGVTLSELFVTGVDIEGERITPSEPDATRCDRMVANWRAICAAAAYAGFATVMGTVGSPVDGEVRDRTWDRAVDTLTRMARVAGEEGVVMTVEPAIGTLADTPDHARKLATAVAKLRLTVDASHFVGQHYTISETLALVEYAAHMHAKPARPGIPKCTLAEGSIDFAALADELVERGFEGDVCVEYIGPWTAELARSPAYQSLAIGEQLQRGTRPSADR